MIRVFLDLDGTVVDFCKESIRVHSEAGNCDADYVPNSWNYYEDWDITAEEFWQEINKHRYFWHGLEKFEYFDELIKLIEKYDGNFKLLTSPTNSENCYAGKFHWIDDNFDFEPSNRAIIHSDKSALVKDEDCVLIDDVEHNCEEWVAAGGKAILMPQAWNKNYHIIDKVDYVKQQLINYYGDM